jgi:two-component system, NtrC family, nitrogen regulation sensor histidine kinase NtrY
MSLRSQLLTLLLATLGALLTFHLLHRQLLGVLPAKGASDEVVSALAQSQADLKELARTDPARRDEYHARFEELQSLANRLRIVDHNREEIAARQQVLVLGAGVMALLAFGLTLLVGARRDARRLRRIGEALAGLAAGERALRLADRSRDHIGVIARMIERASDVIARDRQRLASLRHLASWQEATRRQAHELRTPLTVARLELDRLTNELVAAPLSDVARGSLQEARSELQRVGELVQRFAAFARLPEPDRRLVDLRDLVEEFVATFAAAWPGLCLRAELPEAACTARVDRAMMRQVLVNLCDNSARALAGCPGEARLVLRPGFGSEWVTLDVCDNGPGVPAAVRGRIFEPYVTTSPPGQGMGLGLAISRKILLDHGGDLELRESESGAAFRLLLPVEVACLD